MKTKILKNNQYIEVEMKENHFPKPSYEELVIQYIREKYTQDNENAILRKKLANIDYQDEFTTYNNYVEECKVRARKECE